jgi:hypothetical protein
MLRTYGLAAFTMRATMLSMALTGIAAPAAAGSVYEMAENGGTGVADTILVQDRRLRIETAPTGNTPASTVIFADGALLLLDDDERSYYRITLAALEELSGEFNAAMEQMQAEFANLPPEQRAMMERMMRGRMPNMAAMMQAAPAIRIEQGAADNVNGYSCVEHAVYVNDALTQVACAADYGSVPGAEDVAAVLEDMRGFFERLRGAMPPVLAGPRNSPFDTMSRVEGLPVRTRTYVNGSVLQEIVLSSVETRDIAESRFEVPAGYTEQSLMPQGGPL